MIYRNSEGYHDPTAGIALLNVEKEENKPRDEPKDAFYRLGDLYEFKLWIKLWKGGRK